MTQDSQEERWNSFGWNVIKARGNDINELDRAFNEAKACKGKPSIIIAETVKGCGVSFMENSAKWHHKVPSDEEYEMAKAELAEKRRLAYEQDS